MAVVGIDILREAVTTTATGNDEVMFDNMYSGSRYFFRIGYPNDWSYEAGQYGFYLNKEKHEAVELFPVKMVRETEGTATAQPSDFERVEGVTIAVYQIPIENGDLSYKAKNAMDDLLAEVGGTEGYTFGEPASLTTKNVTFYRTEYSYYEEGVTHRCALYTATRSMCKYVIVTDCKGYLEGEYKETMDKMIKDFRFSVFDD